MSTATGLAACGVATVYEAAGRSGLVDVDLVQVVPGSKAAGRARTVRCGQGDNLMVHAALSQVGAGEVLVLTMPRAEPVALVGELIGRQAAYRRVAAVLVDAAVRDVDELAALGLPVWARWVRVKGATKAAVGELDVPVTMGGTQIRTGDVVVLDADGGVVIPAGREEEVLAAANARTGHEAQARARYQDGALAFDLLGLRGIVEAR